MGRRLARLIHLDKHGAAKVAALDADQTLWGGIVGEAGVDQIDLFDNGPGEAHREFQRYMVELHRAGLLLTIVSKNDPDVVWEAFGRSEMVVQQSHLATSRVSWDEKADSITAIADELNLGTASIVLVDDSPIECEKVAFQLPEVRTLLMPEDVVGWYDVIGRSGAFDRLPPNDTDRMRAASYQQEAQRRVLRSASSMADFFASLELRVDIRRLESADVPRVAQLIAKTNQFTLGGTRHSEAEVAAMVDDDRLVGFAVSASDRFGDYGTIGAMVIDRAPATTDSPAGAAVLDTFVLSCRAMGRGVETAMLATAFDVSPSVCAKVEETPRNQPARDFFAEHGCTLAGERSDLRQPAWPAHINARSDGQS
jgi:FkbH-like protein